MRIHGEQGGQTLQKCLSYNDLKRKRMGRSLNNMKNTHVLVEDKQKIMRSGLLLTSINMKKIKNIDGVNSRMKQLQADKQKQNRKYINIQGLAESFPHINFKQNQQINSNQPINEEKRQAVYKKTKSMRIITKKSGKNFLPNKQSSHLLNRIDGMPNFKPVNICNQSLLKKYKTVPNHQQNNQSQINQNQSEKQRKKQDIFFNAISPIHRKNQLLNTLKREQASGFSILEDMDQKIIVNSFQVSDNNLSQRFKFFKSQMPDLHLASQVEFKMPKIVKKHLPRDFFLRV